MRVRQLVTAVAMVGAIAVAVVSPAAGPAAAAPIPIDHASPAIVGGTTATGNYPWAAALLYSDGSQACTGSLIASQWVITAAHCLSDTAKVRVGSKDYTSGGTLLGVARKVRGSKDIALIKLSAPVTYAPVRIAAASPAPGAAVRLMGWGVTCDSGCDSPRLLKQLDTTVIADSRCTRDDIDGPTELCTKVTTSQTACYGDSGGPALVDGLLVGADDRGGNVCGDTGGEIYKDVTAYRAWITQYTGV